MTAKIYQNLLVQFTNSLSSFSLVNGDGQLLFSKDSKPEYLTTSRLVAFQIVKKYLRPKPSDLIILNDPENGGFSFTKIIFVACLHENLNLIWEEELSLVDFKIPPTPLFEGNQKNSFVWSALVDNHPESAVLRRFFETQKEKLDFLVLQKEAIQNLALQKNQTTWLKASQEIFEIQFSNKATGSVECSYRTPSNQMIKLKLLVEERQNIKLMTLDFTNTSLASDYSAASHVVESGMIQKIIQYYQIENFFSQAVLDKIKIILPPKSIVSKAHPQGEWNHEIQSLCSQLCLFNLTQLNSQARKMSVNFEAASELKMDLIDGTHRYPMNFDTKSICLEGFEFLLTQHHVNLIQCQRGDHNVHLCFEVADSNQKILQIKAKLFTEGKDYSLKVNNEIQCLRKISLKPKDRVQIDWKMG